MDALVNAPRRERSSFKQLGNLKRLFTYIRRYAWVLGAAVLGLLFTRIFDAVVPLLMKTAIDSLADPSLEPNYAWPALAIIGVVARRVMRRVSISVAYDLRKRVFRHIQFQGTNFLNHFSTGDLMSRSINDINMVRMVVSFGAVDMILFTFTIATGMYFMRSLSPELTRVVVIPLPLVAIAGFVMARMMFPFYRDQQESMAAVTSFVQENLNGIRTIKAMSQEKQEIERFNGVSSNYAKMVYRASRFNAWIGFVMPVLSSASPAILLLYGGRMALNGEIRIGTFTAFGAYMWMVIWPIRYIGMALSMFTAAAAGTQRIFEVLDVPLLVLANWGEASYILYDTDFVEGGYQLLGFALSGLAIWLGIRKQMPDTVNAGNVFFTVFLYIKFYDWWWEWMPKYIFFLLIGLTALLMLVFLQRLKRALAEVQA